MTKHDERFRGRHPIRVVALRTGLSPSVLRAWERRYGVVTPSRSDGGQRLYSDADIDRLTLLNRATQAGRSISQVAQMDSNELESLVAEDEVALRAEMAAGGNGGSRASQLVEHEALGEALSAVEQLDGDRLEAILKRAAVDAGAVGVIDRLLVPLMRRIGDRWQEGTLRPRHEHLASAALRSVVGWMSEAIEATGDAASIVIATPSGELHDNGALLAAAAAASEGWRVTYLGADLPVEDIVESAREVNAAVVGLSVINPADMGRVARLVGQVRQRLPDSVTLILGGAAAGALGVVLDRPGVVRLATLSEFRSTLRSLRAPAES